MLSSANLPPNTTPVDEDMVEQARPGHGIPSQDPTFAAQFPLEPDEATREANSTLTGGGLIAGMTAGAVIGVMVAGPVGVAVGAALGAVSGALGGAAVGATMNLENSSRTDKAPAVTVRLHIDDSGGEG